MSEQIDTYGNTYDDTSPGATPEPESWRHPVNVGQLVMGIAFAGMVVVWALIVGDVVGEDDIQWLMPIPWVSAGIAGLVAMAVAARRRT